jgi:cephalosporin-C deacetylase-like acetyl esterase
MTSFAKTFPRTRQHAVCQKLLAAGLVTLLTVASCLAQQLTVTPYHASGIYNSGDTVGWNVALPDGATPPTNGYSYTLKINNLEVMSTGQLDLSSGKGKIETSLTEPGTIFLQLTAPRGAGVGGTNGGRGGGGRFGGGGGGRGGGLLYGAVVDPLKIMPSAPRPADFDSFWAGKLAELKNVPINPVLTPIDSGRSNVEFYTVKLDSLNSHVQGYLAKPAREGKFPAILYYQYAGVYALDKNIALTNAASGWLIMDVDSHDLAPDARTGVSSGYQSIGNTNRETSYFLNMYLRDVRAVDYLTSRPDWNGKVLVAMGMSMGGQQSLATAGLDPRITHLIVEVPSGTDFDGPLHGRAAGYPNWGTGDPRVMETGLYFDTVNFAPNIKATCFVAMGFRDTIASPVGIWTMFNQIKSPKEIAPMAQAGHNNQSTALEQKMWTDGQTAWLTTLVNGGEIKPNTTTAAP